MEDNLDDLIIHNLGGPRILYTENSKEVVSVREDIEYVSSPWNLEWGTKGRGGIGLPLQVGWHQI